MPPSRARALAVHCSAVRWPTGHIPANFLRRRGGGRRLGPESRVGPGINIAQQRRFAVSLFSVRLARVLPAATSRHLQTVHKLAGRNSRPGPPGPKCWCRFRGPPAYGLPRRGDFAPPLHLPQSSVNRGACDLLKTRYGPVEGNKSLSTPRPAVGAPYTLREFLVGERKSAWRETLGNSDLKLCRSRRNGLPAEATPRTRPGLWWSGSPRTTSGNVSARFPARRKEPICPA